MNRADKRWLLIWIIPTIAVALGAAYYAARNWNGPRPLIGEPKPKHFDLFASRFKAAMISRGVPIVRQETNVRRTDSLTHPLVGEITASFDETYPLTFRFNWENGRWVVDGGSDTAEAATAEAQK
jgi:hypothetical protein